MTSTERDDLPVTALLPGSLVEPIVIYDSLTALRMAVVERAGAHLLGSEWDIPGDYILLDPVDGDGNYGAYVGQAPAGLRSRLGSHLRTKDHWRRALLITKDTTFGFHSAHAGWLEGRLWQLLNDAEHAELHNGNRPKDETLPPYERTALEACARPSAGSCASSAAASTARARTGRHRPAGDTTPTLASPSPS